jgi:hypothetical protein
MGTEIKTSQIINDKLAAIDTTLKDEGRREPYDLAIEAAVPVDSDLEIF